MNFTCPYCHIFAIITEPVRDVKWHHFKIDEKNLEYDHQLSTGVILTACPNPDCKKITLETTLNKTRLIGYTNTPTPGEVIKTWKLLPDSYAIPQPDYIPKQIVEDYYEACRIINLSPKSSATLARRVLQGMIRDFWKIDKPKLFLAIQELKDKVDPSTWAAIDAVRSLGNIGAHMEMDVNLIIDIDPDEAKLLINLIEDLFKDWYVVRHERKQRNLIIGQLVKTKARERNQDNT